MIQLPNTKIEEIGDPHFAKPFVTGVPIERLGERESDQMLLFKQKLLADCDLNVCLGDIFDKFTVEDNILFSVYSAYAEAASMNPARQYVLVMGNHDASRNLDLVSSFTILKIMLAHLDNVYIIDTMTEMTTKNGDRILVVPFNAFLKSDEIIKNNGFDRNKYAAIFGHWELESYGGEDFMLIPKDLLATMTDLVVTGHIHTPSDTMYGNLRIIGTGSMMPYSHGEDPHEQIYVTRTLADYNAAVAINPAEFRDKVLRLILAPGEEVPAGIDAKQVTTAAAKGEADTKELQVAMDEFSFEALFKSQFKLAGLSDEATADWWEKYQEVSEDAAHA